MSHSCTASSATRASDAVTQHSLLKKFNRTVSLAVFPDSFPAEHDVCCTSQDELYPTFNMLTVPFARLGRLISFTAFAATGAALAFGQTELDETLSTLEEWVDMERRIASEAAEWEVEKESLENLIGLYRDELEALNETIRDAEEDVSAAEAARAELNAESERLSTIEGRVTEAIIAGEERFRALHGALPDPLQEEIQPVFAQIPTDSRETSLSIGQRIQFIVAGLTQIQKFNTAVTVTEEFRAFESGNQVQVDAIYFGLGTAYYVDQRGEHAGFAVLAEDGWQWQDDAALAPLVRQVITIYSAPGNAAFVELPVNIQ